MWHSADACLWSCMCLHTYYIMGCKECDQVGIMVSSPLSSCTVHNMKISHTHYPGLFCGVVTALDNKYPSCWAPKKNMPVVPKAQSRSKWDGKEGREKKQPLAPSLMLSAASSIILLHGAHSPSSKLSISIVNGLFFFCWIYAKYTEHLHVKWRMWIFLWRFRCILCHYT